MDGSLSHYPEILGFWTDKQKSTKALWTENSKSENPGFSAHVWTRLETRFSGSLISNQDETGLAENPWIAASESRQIQTPNLVEDSIRFCIQTVAFWTLRFKTHSRAGL
jgi:hypothetical protein